MKKILAILATGTIATLGAGAVLTKAPDKGVNLDEIATIQQQAKTETGKYMQLTKDGRGIEKGKASAKIESVKKPGLVIHEWVSPNGSGYQVILEEDGIIQSWGYGDDPAEVADRTYRIEPIASTTP